MSCYLQRFAIMVYPVTEKFASYPAAARNILTGIRILILEQARKDGLGAVDETLKWGEPSYLIKGGSTIRVDWKPGVPDQVGVYFNCNSSLISTFRELYGNLFRFEGNRAISLALTEPLPKAEHSHCFHLALNYHKLEKLPLLGA